MYKVKVAIFSIILFCCCNNKDKKVINENKLRGDSVKFFISPVLLSKNDKKSMLIEDFVKIEDDEIIKEMVNSWKGKKVASSNFNFNNESLIYTGILVNSNTNSPLTYVYFDSELKYIRTSKGVFEFKRKLVLSYKKYFEKLNCFNVCVKGLYNSRELFNFINNNLGYTSQEKYDWQKFEGTYLFKRKEPNIPENREISEYMKELVENEFRESKSNVKYKEIRPVKNTDSSFVRILADSIKKIPSQYNVKEGFKRFEENCFRVMDIKKSQIISISKRKNIELDTLHRCNFELNNQAK